MTLVAIIAALLSVALVGLVRRVAGRRGIIDVPTHRSSHAVPTPRGGGVGLLLGVLLAGAIATIADLGVAKAGTMAPDVIAMVCALAALLVTAAIGWRDDHGGVPVRIRLAIHLVSGLLILPLALTVPLPVAWPLAAVWWVLWTVSSINVVNFVDGIDGLIGLQALVFGLHLIVAGERGGSAALLGALLAGASAGFLAWNWSPARIFLGDVGSGGLGVLFIIGGALLAAEGRYGFIAAFLPLAPIFLDASVTLASRARRGERLSEPHRQHLYQRLANGGLGHARVTLSYATAAAVAAALAWLRPRAGLLLLVLVLAALGAIGALARHARYEGKEPAARA